MDPIERINELFADSAGLSGTAARIQAEPIALAAQCIVNGLLCGGRVLCCGSGGSATDAQYFATLMQHRFERERPGLPAIALDANPALLAAISEDNGPREIFAKQINALGQPGDVLLVFSVDGNAASATAALEAAAERQMQVVAITGQDGGELATRLPESAVAIRTPALRPARILENHRLVIHCLCDLIDLQLMGG